MGDNISNLFFFKFNSVGERIKINILILILLSPNAFGSAVFAIPEIPNLRLTIFGLNASVATFLISKCFIGGYKSYLYSKTVIGLGSDFKNNLIGSFYFFKSILIGGGVVTGNPWT